VRVAKVPAHSTGRHLRYQHTQAVRAVLAERYAPANVNKHLSAPRGVLKECWRLGLMAAEDHQRAADLETVRGTSLLRGRALSSGEVGGLLGTCAIDAGAGHAAGVRDAALLAVLYGAGCAERSWSRSIWRTMTPRRAR